MQVSSLHSPSNLDKIPLSRKYVAGEGTYFCPCLTHLQAFPLPRGYRPVPHFGSVVQLSPKSRVDTDFRLGLRVLSNLLLETTKDSDHTASLGKLLHCLWVMVKKSFQISDLNLSFNPSSIFLAFSITSQFVSILIYLPFMLISMSSNLWNFLCSQYF